MAANRHAIHRTAAKAGRKDVAHETERTPRLHVKCRNSRRGGEGRVKVFGIGGQPDTIGGAGVGGRAVEVSSHGVRQAVDAHNVAIPGIRYIDAGICAVGNRDHAGGCEEAALDAAPPGYHAGLSAQRAIRVHRAERGRAWKWGRLVVVGDDETAQARAGAQSHGTEHDGCECDSQSPSLRSLAHQV